MKVCKATGQFERGDINPFICTVCGYVAKSSRGLTQHKSKGTSCQDRTRLDKTKSTMSTLELTVTVVSIDSNSFLSNS